MDMQVLVRNAITFQSFSVLSLQFHYLFKLNISLNKKKKIMEKVYDAEGKHKKTWNTFQEEYGVLFQCVKSDMLGKPPITLFTPPENILD
jgi:hypothetical protein